MEEGKVRVQEIPVGVILALDTQYSLPEGWAYCNGENGTRYIPLSIWHPDRVYIQKVKPDADS